MEAFLRPMFSVLSEEEPLTASTQISHINSSLSGPVDGGAVATLVTMATPTANQAAVLKSAESLQVFGFIAALPDVGLGQDMSTGPAWSPVSSVPLSREVCSWSNTLLRSKPVLWTKGL